MLYLAQFGTTTIAGQSLTNLNVIAAVVIGGTSIFGGYGSMFGTVVGLFIPAILQSGFVIIGVDPFWQGVAVGASWSPPSTSTRPAAPRPLRGANQTQGAPQPSKAAATPATPPPPHHRSRVTTMPPPMEGSTPSGTTSTPRRAPPRPSGPGSVRPADPDDRAPAPRRPRRQGLQAIAFVQGVAGDKFYITMQCGIEDEAAKLGVTVDTQGPQKFDPTLQKPILDSVMATKPDAHPDRPDRRRPPCRRPLEPAAEAGIKVVLVDTTTEDPSFAVSADRLRQRRRRQAAFDAIKQLNPGGGKVLVISDRPRHLHHRRPGQGLPGRRRRPTRPSSTSACSTRTTTRPPRPTWSTSALQKDPDIVGIFADQPVRRPGHRHRHRQAGKKDTVKIVGFDAGPDQIKALQGRHRAGAGRPAARPPSASTA